MKSWRTGARAGALLVGAVFGHGCGGTDIGQNGSPDHGHESTDAAADRAVEGDAKPGSSPGHADASDAPAKPGADASSDTAPSADAVAEQPEPDTDAAEAAAPDALAPSDSDAGLTCLPAFPVVAIGNYQKATCGVFDVTNVIEGDAGSVYFFSVPHRRIVPWSAITGVCSPPILLAASPQFADYSRANHRLYVAYATGDITSMDPGTGVEQAFAKTPLATKGLACADRFVVAVDSNAAHYVFDPAGSLVVTTGIYVSREYSWSQTNSRLYFFRDDYSPNDLHYEHIDCATGKVDSRGETPYHGSYDIRPPIRPSPDGKSVLIGAGEIYDGLSLKRVTSLPGITKDAAWLPDGKILVLRDAGTSCVVEQRSSDGAHIENLQRFEGTPVALRSIGDGAVVVTRTGTTPAFSIYHANVDGDGDGVPYSADALPLDAAASVDTDRDGSPDAFNAGGGGGSSLVLDAFPADSACQLASQARADDATRCDIDASIPVYTPTSVAFDGADVVYLFSSSLARVFRYSTVQAKHLNPLILRDKASFMTFAPTLGKLYFAYPDGSISSMAPAGPAETEFATVPGAPHGLAEVGKFVLAADPSGAWSSHYTFAADGRLVAEKEWNYQSREYAFSDSISRVYFFRDDTSPNDLHWESIDQSTGGITGAGESPYHGDITIQPPIRVSLDAGYVLLGTGDIFDGVLLKRQLTLPIAPVDAVWLPGNSLFALTADNTLRKFDNTFVAGPTQAITGTPLRVFFSQGKLIVVTLVAGRPSFSLMTP